MSGVQSAASRRRGALARPVLLLGVLALGFATQADAQEWAEFRSARQVNPIDDHLELSLVYGAGRLTIEPAADGILYDVRMTYDAEKFKPLRSWERTADGAELTIALTSAGDDGSWIEFAKGDFDINPDIELDFDDLRDLGRSPGSLSLELGGQTTTSLSLAVGAAQSEIDLGGTALSDLKLRTGASHTRISFARPNRVRMNELSIHAGAAEIETEQLGNARFDRFDFNGGVGDVTLDFTGEWDGDATGTVKMGVGSLRVLVPAEIGLWIKKSTFLTSFDAPGFTSQGDGFRSPNWSDAEHKFELSIEAAFGSVEVERVR